MKELSIEYTITQQYNMHAVCLNTSKCHALVKTPHLKYVELTTDCRHHHRIPACMATLGDSLLIVASLKIFLLLLFLILPPLFCLSFTSKLPWSRFSEVGPAAPPKTRLLYLSIHRTGGSFLTVSSIEV